MLALDLAAATEAQRAIAISDLKGALAKLADRNRTFGDSLVAQFERRRDLSPKQWPWVGRLIDMAQNGETKRETHAIGDMVKIAELFDLARDRLKFPAIVLALDNAQVRLSVATERARVPGSINVVVTAPDKPETWVGRILKTGTLEKSPRLADAIPANLLALLNRFAENPHQTAAEFGRLHGVCCFCGLVLNDPASAEAGFGKTCAKNWNMADDYKAAAQRVKNGTATVTKRAA